MKSAWQVAAILPHPYLEADLFHVEIEKPQMSEAPISFPRSICNRAMRMTARDLERAWLDAGQW